MKSFFKYLIIFISFFLFIGCSTSQSKIDIKKQVDTPKKYINGDNKLKIEDSWLLVFNNKKIEELVNKAINKNYNLKQLYYDIEIRKQELITTQSYLFPEISGALNHNKTGDFEGASSTNLSSLELTLSYEIDLWGKLSDANKKSNLQILESNSLYEEAKQELIADVTISYFDIVESNRLLESYRKNLDNIKSNYKIVESRYKQGLSTALDTYLAQNMINEQIKKISEQKTIKSNAIHKLEVLLGSYPYGVLDINDVLPLLDKEIALGLPSDLIFRKASLNASWNKLLAQNYQLAFTHKQRLPSLNLSATIGQTSESGAPVIWSLLGGLTAPLFNAGRLKANEEIELLELKKIELEYLDNVYSAYMDIENAIIQEKELKEQYQSILKSNSNTKASSKLAFSQYLKGLVDYTTVLDSQQSYYEAQASLIQIKKELLENRINLHLALGGDFLSKE